MPFSLPGALSPSQSYPKIAQGSHIHSIHVALS